MAALDRAPRQSPRNMFPIAGLEPLCCRCAVVVCLVCACDLVCDANMGVLTVLVMFSVCSFYYVEYDKILRYTYAVVWYAYCCDAITAKNVIFLGHWL